MIHSITPRPTRRQRKQDDSTRDDPVVTPFKVRGSGALNWLRWRRRWVSVWLGEGVLHVATRSDRPLAVPVDRIRHILIGREPFRFATGYRLEIWPENGRSIILTAFEGRDEMPDFMALVRGLAIVLERHGALDRMRIGLPPLYALGIPTLVFVCLYGSIRLAIWSEGHIVAALQDELLTAFAALVIALIPACWTIRQGFHRRLNALSELDRVFGRN